MHWLQRLSLVAFALAGAQQAPAQTPLPELRFFDPVGFYRSAAYPPADFSSTEVNASLQVYPFRPVNGDVRQMFSRTLLREWVDARYQERSVAPGATVDAIMLPGADVTLRARFREVVGGQVHERMRLAVVAGSAVAIVDATASSLSGWNRIMPQLNAFASTLQVTRGAAIPLVAAPTSAGRAVAGLYEGFLYKYDAVRGQSVYSAQYYLLSADGRVYRAYDDITVPGRDPARFDFDAVRRSDPVNFGQYSVSGDSIVIRLGSPQQPETITAQFVSGNTLVIRGVRYERR